MNQELLVAHLSLAGRKHRDKGLPCEDASCSLTKNGVTVVCLSDGAGANQYTHAELGSKCVVQTVCDMMVNHFDAFFFETRESVIRSTLVASIQTELTILASEHSLPGMECMSATMLFCAIKDSRVIFGHIGDGIIAQVTGSGMQVVTLPQNGEAASSTFFITLPNAQDYLRIIRSTIDDTHAYILMTDGISDMVYDHTKMLVKPVVARLAELAVLPPKEKAVQLSQTIRSYIIDVSPLSDDTSIGIIYCKGTSKPDPETLPTDKPFNIRDVNDDMKKVQNEILPRVRLAKEIVTHGSMAITDLVSAKSEESIEDKTTESISTESNLLDSVSDTKDTKSALAFLFVGFSIALVCFIIGAMYYRYI